MAEATRQRILLAFAKLRKVAQPDKGPSINAVAREAGVSHTLIHTKYPDIADKIRDVSGRNLSQQLAKRQEDLKACENRSADLRREVANLRSLNRSLASENARLGLMVIQLEQRVTELEAGVRPLHQRTEGATNQVR